MIVVIDSFTRLVSIVRKFIILVTGSKFSVTLTIHCLYVVMLETAVNVITHFVY